MQALIECNKISLTHFSWAGEQLDVGQSFAGRRRSRTDPFQGQWKSVKSPGISKCYLRIEGIWRNLKWNANVIVMLHPLLEGILFQARAKNLSENRLVDDLVNPRDNDKQWWNHRVRRCLETLHIVTKHGVRQERKSSQQRRYGHGTFLWSHMASSVFLDHGWFKDLLGMGDGIPGGDLWWRVSLGMGAVRLWCHGCHGWNWDLGLRMRRMRRMRRMKEWSCARGSHWSEGRCHFCDGLGGFQGGTFRV